MKTKSFLRRKEHQIISKLHLDGKILDVGGSKKSGYQEMIKGDHTFVVGNIDPSYGIDIVFDAQKRWPFDNGSFSAVLFMNLLEHLYDYRTAVSESYRVLKNGGKTVGVVPFIYSVHGSPSDNFRYSRFALEKIFIDAGYSSIEIQELGSGAFSLIYHALIGFVRWYWLANVLIFVCEKLDQCLAYIKPNNKMSAKFMPIGYYFEAKK